MGTGPMAFWVGFSLFHALDGYSFLFSLLEVCPLCYVLVLSLSLAPFRVNCGLLL